MVYIEIRDPLVAQLVKNPPAMQVQFLNREDPLEKGKDTLVAQRLKHLSVRWETWVRSLGWEDPLEKGKATTPVFWPGQFRGLYSPWGCKELDTTERLSLHFNF